MIKNVWVGTSLRGKLHRIYMLQCDLPTKKSIFEIFEEDAKYNWSSEKEIRKLDGNALIEDVEYYINFNDIYDSHYLCEFKSKINDIKLQEGEILEFKKSLTKEKTGQIKNFQDRESVKFLAVEDEKGIYFLAISRNGVVKNKQLLKFNTDINEHATIYSVPRGVTVPSKVTARYDYNLKKLYVYQVNSFEDMLSLNESRLEKAKVNLTKFTTGELRIASEGYTFIGLDSEEVIKEIESSNRSIRRLAQYEPPTQLFDIGKIKDAVGKLDEELRIQFNDENREIIITSRNAKTFVGIINNRIVQRLITGDVELVI